MNTNRRRTGARLALALLAVGTAAIAIAGPALAANPQANSSAQGANVNIPNVLVTAASATPTTATNDGSGTGTPVVGAPGVLPSGTALVGSTGPLREVAQAGADGSSYACAGYGGLVFNLSSTCQATPGVATVIIHLNAIPAIKTALAGTICPDPLLEWTTLYSTASNNGAGTLSGSATASSFHIQPCGKAGQPADCAFFGTFPTGTGPNVDLMALILSQMSPAAGCAPMVAGLQSVQSQIDLEFNHQTTPSAGVLRVDALHASSPAGGFDLGSVTVGPNSLPQVDTPLVSVDAWWLVGGVGLVAAFVGRELRRRRKVGATG